jgi:hypothetical protein
MAAAALQRRLVFGRMYNVPTTDSIDAENYDGVRAETNVDMEFDDGIGRFEIDEEGTLCFLRSGHIG